MRNKFVNALYITMCILVAIMTIVGVAGGFAYAIIEIFLK